MVVVGADDFRREPEFSRGDRDQRQVGADVGVVRKLDARTRRQQPRGGEIRHAGGDEPVQSLANQLMSHAGREAQDAVAFQQFFVGLAHKLVTG